MSHTVEVEVDIDEFETSELIDELNNLTEIF